MEDKRKQNRQDDIGSKNALEWTVFGISLLLIMAVFAYLSYKVYTEQPTTPDLVVSYKPDPAKFAPHRYLVKIENKGGETAEGVSVEIVMVQNGEELEKADMEIPFVPKESAREGWVIFRKDPSRADTIISRVVSYKKP